MAEILLREGAFSPPVLMLRQVVACVLWNKDRYPGNLHLRVSCGWDTSQWLSFLAEQVQ